MRAAEARVVEVRAAEVRKAEVREEEARAVAMAEGARVLGRQTGENLRAEGAAVT